MTQVPFPKNDPFLKVQERAEAAIAQYRMSGSSFFNILVLGDSGSGKTSLAATCPFPVFIDSFDPGGTKTEALQALIERGDIIVDNRWETDTWKKPFAFREWEKEMFARRDEDFFSYLGTYILDSATKWSDSMMFEILRLGRSKSGASRVGQRPEIQDYLDQQLTAVDWVSFLMGMKCNVLVTGHLGLEKDELSGKIESGPLMYGKLAKKFPIAFDECYVARPRPTASGSEYRIQTQNDGYYIAKSRIGGTKFEMFEAPNVKELMKLAKAKEVTFTDKSSISRSASA